ncbi:inhibitor of trypsin and hageman factor [Phtheirospermum japonicum]|uniref:Inhibitor of trypsin and hageman factor n=1 Tax=Phtheirospermum japonicum TaxID=374723 RepID=A0A830D8J9_9LAMI|nr:inhibitor of trypsin and hageman factor [Phtheirospermum japonicum]
MLIYFLSTCINICTLTGKKYKSEWPELVGLPGPQCKATIERDNPTVVVVLVPPPGWIDRDFCCNRVYVFLDDGGLCLFAPKLG